MDLNHLHLHVRDLARARQFYRDHFGFRKPVVQHGGFLILRNDEGFDLGLLEDSEPDPVPEWFHFGFRMPSAEAVHTLHGRLKKSGVRIVRPLSEVEFLHFRCADPDGHQIEIYYE